MGAEGDCGGEEDEDEAAAATAAVISTAAGTAADSTSLALMNRARGLSTLRRLTALHSTFLSLSIWGANPEDLR